MAVAGADEVAGQDGDWQGLQQWKFLSMDCLNARQ
jgi:hypothetical protein